MKKMKLSESVAEKIREMISNKEYDSNGYLPSEGELALRYEVSRPTLREAVGIMEARGLIKRIHGKGLQVVDNTSQILRQSLEDMIAQENNILDELLEVRIIIEPMSAKLAAMRRTEEDLEQLRSYVEIMEQTPRMDETYYEADLNFHINLAKSGKNRIQASLIEAYTSVLRQLIIESSRDGQPLEQKYHYHRNILDAVERQDSDMAYHEMEHHLEATKKNKYGNIVAKTK